MSTAVRINAFFREIGLPLRHHRQSWGAADGPVVLLKTWSDEWDQKAREVPVLRMSWHEGNERRFGLKERLAHLHTLWNEQLAGYALIAESRDSASPTRTSKPLRNTDIHPIAALRPDPGGVIIAVLDDPISSPQLHEHARSHRTRAPSGPLPLSSKLAEVLKEFIAKEGGAARRTEEEFRAREERFARVQVRTEQAAFRLAVFRAYLGCCAVSGCEVPEALEAAHLSGRDWRKGHNSAKDGVLLRRDLHALYDRGLLEIARDRTIRLAANVARHYGEFDGALVSLPISAKND